MSREPVCLSSALLSEHQFAEHQSIKRKIYMNPPEEITTGVNAVSFEMP